MASKSRLNREEEEVENAVQKTEDMGGVHG